MRWGRVEQRGVGWFNPLSPFSGCYRDVIWAIESLYQIQIQCNVADIYGGLAP